MTDLDCAERHPLYSLQLTLVIGAGAALPWHFPPRAAGHARLLANAPGRRAFCPRCANRGSRVKCRSQETIGPAREAARDTGVSPAVALTSAPWSIAAQPADPATGAAMRLLWLTAGRLDLARLRRTAARRAAARRLQRSGSAHWRPRRFARLGPHRRANHVRMAPASGHRSAVGRRYGPACAGGNRLSRAAARAPS